VAVVALILVSASGNAGAVVGGAVPLPTPTWNAEIVINGGAHVCSGALIAQSWVLTAAQCVRKNKVGAFYPRSSFRISVGKSAQTVHGFSSGVDRAPASQAVSYGAKLGWIHDIALLHLTTPAPTGLAPLPLRFSSAAVSSGAKVSFFGWGFHASKAATALYSTAQGDWSFTDTCHAADQACYHRTSGATSYPANGDSGAPVVAFVRGGWVDVGLFSGPNGNVATSTGASVLRYLGWIRSRAGLPSVPTNTIVQDQASGARWLVGADGFRHSIPTVGDYQCFTARGINVITMSPFAAGSIPLDSTTPGMCNSRFGHVYWVNLGDGNPGTVRSVPRGTGGSVMSLASGRSQPMSLAVDRTHVYWADYGYGNASGSVDEVPLDGGPVTTLASGQAGPYSVAVDSANVYWANFDGGTVNKVPLGGGPVTTLASGQDSPDSVAVDGTNVYWVTLNGGTVNEVPIGGGSVTTLAGGQSLPSAIAVDATHVFWVNFGDGTVNEVPLGGGSVTTLATGQGQANSVAVDGTHVYWGSEDAGTVNEVSLGGGSVTTLASGQDAPHGVAVDDTGVYWVDRAFGQWGTVSEVPLGGGPVTTLATSQGEPWAVAVGP
jgi:hypothetical protein